MNEDELLRGCYEILADCGMQRPPWDEWSRHARENCEVWPIGAGPGRSTLVGFILFKGHSVHIAVKPEWHGRWLTPSALRAWRASYTHDCDLYATPDIDNEPARRLCEGLGFRLQRTLGKSAIYVKERTPCLQP